VVSQLLTLFTTPIVYIYMDRINESMRGWRSRKSNTDTGKAAEEAASS
jgi:hypothetical protein